MSILVYIANAGLLLGLVWWLKRQAWAQELGLYFYPALILKLLCGILLGLLYFEYYGGGDTIFYQKASGILTALAKQDAGAYTRLLLFNEFPNEAFRAAVPFSRFPGFTNSFYFIKLLSLLNLLTGSSYYINSLYFSLFSFWGAVRLAAALARIFPRYKYAAIVAFLFFPSVAFWSSGILKDAILFGSMCWVIAFVLLLANGRRLHWSTIILAPMMLFLFYRIKFFVAFLVLPLLLLYLLIKLLSRRCTPFRSAKRQVLLMSCVVVVSALAGMQFFKVYQDGFLYRNLVGGYENLLAQSLQKPHITYHQLKPTIGSITRNAPEAVFSAVYRPFLWEADNWLYFLMALENLLILLLTILALGAVLNGRKRNVQVESILFTAIVLVLAVIFGLSTPNFGTLSRYRIAFLPFLIYLLLQNHYVQVLLRKR